jgi:hypothetical protein
MLSFVDWRQYFYGYIDIKRNMKISLHSHSSSDEPGGKIHTIKYTNTDQLEKIYIKKSKPMVAVKRQVKNCYLSSAEEKGERQQEMERGKGIKSIEKLSLFKVEHRTGTTEKYLADGRRPESSTKSRGLSKIYNLTFK